MESVITILRDNWMLLLVGQYPSGPLGGLAITRGESARPAGESLTCPRTDTDRAVRRG